MQLIDKIENEQQYNDVMRRIEVFIKKATDNGGFHSLPKSDAEELGYISLLAEQYEDNILELMPLNNYT